MNQNFNFPKVCAELQWLQYLNTDFKIEAWDTAEQRRQFFVEYAVQNEFDPLIAENWYTQPLSKIMSTKV